MKNYLYIALMALVTYLIRVLPLTLIRKPIKSVFLRSFLYYVPYVTLSLMTFPRHYHRDPIAFGRSGSYGRGDPFCLAGSGAVSRVFAVLRHGCGSGAAALIFS